MTTAINDLFHFTWDIYQLLHHASLLIINYMSQPISYDLANMLNIPHDTTNIEFMLIIGLTITLSTLVIKMFTSILG